MEKFLRFGGEECSKELERSPYRSRNECSRAIREFFASTFEQAHEYLNKQHMETLQFMKELNVSTAMHGDLQFWDKEERDKTSVTVSSSLDSGSTVGSLGCRLPASAGAHKNSRLDAAEHVGSLQDFFNIGVRVVITKKSRLEGKTACVLDPNWNGLVKVIMDEEDEKGKIKSFCPSDLKRCARVFSPGDRVKVVKKTRLEGKSAVVIDPGWNGLVKVCMDEADDKGQIKSFKPSQLTHCEIDVKPEYFKILEPWESLRWEIEFQNEKSNCHSRSFGQSTARLTFESSIRSNRSTSSLYKFQGIGGYRIARFVSHPFGPVRMIQDYLCLCFMLWDMVVIPLGLFELQETASLSFIRWASRLFWTFVDMPLSFVAGYLTQDGSLEQSFANMARRYMRSWFLFDLFLVGADWLDGFFFVASAQGASHRHKQSREVFRVIRLTQLMRVVRIRQNYARLANHLNSDKIFVIVDVAKLIVMMIAFGHLVGCGWYAIARSCSSDNWVNHFGWNDKPLHFRYTMSLRWAMSHYSGGMDQVVPISLAEHVYATFAFLMGYLFGAVFLSILTSTLTQFYLLTGQHHQQLMSLRQYLSQHGISTKLTMIILNAADAISEHRFRVPDLMQKVPDHLREKLHYEMFCPVLDQHPFLDLCLEHCKPAIVSICNTAMCQVYVTVGDVIFHLGETPVRPQAYILRRGHLTYGCVECEEKKWIAEASLWMKWAHRGYLLAQQNAEVCTLETVNFSTVIKRFKDLIGYMILEYATSFVDYMRAIDDEADDLISGPTHATFFHGETRISASEALSTAVPARHSRNTSQTSSSQPDDYPKIATLPMCEGARHVNGLLKRDSDFGGTNLWKAFSEIEWCVDSTMDDSSNQIRRTVRPFPGRCGASNCMFSAPI